MSIETNDKEKLDIKNHDNEEFTKQVWVRIITQEVVEDSEFY